MCCVSEHVHEPVFQNMYMNLCCVAEHVHELVCCVSEHVRELVFQNMYMNLRCVAEHVHELWRDRLQHQRADGRVPEEVQEPGQGGIHCRHEGMVYL